METTSLVSLLFSGEVDVSGVDATLTLLRLV